MQVSRYFMYPHQYTRNRTKEGALFFVLICTQILLNEFPAAMSQHFADSKNMKQKNKLQICQRSCHLFAGLSVSTFLVYLTY